MTSEETQDAVSRQRQINCRDTALPCPDFGNINNSDATGFDMTYFRRNKFYE